MIPGGLFASYFENLNTLELISIMRRGRSTVRSFTPKEQAKAAMGIDYKL
jgi:hypothetical protein